MSSACSPVRIVKSHRKKKPMKPFYGKMCAHELGLINAARIEGLLESGAAFYT
ncbi:hypothetical protein SHVI106290_06330 [Shewanella violacea]